MTARERAIEILSMLNAINVHLGYQFTQPLALATEAIEQAILDAELRTLDEVLAGIAREQNYREYRSNECGDQDGSAIGACKEIAGYVRALAEQGRNG